MTDGRPIGGESFCREGPTRGAPLLDTYPIYVLSQEVLDTLDFYALTGETEEFAFLSALDGGRIWADGHALPVGLIPLIALPSRNLGVLEEAGTSAQTVFRGRVKVEPEGVFVVLYLPTSISLGLSLYDPSGRRVEKIFVGQARKGIQIFRVRPPHKRVYFLRVRGL